MLQGRCSGVPTSSRAYPELTKLGSSISFLIWDIVLSSLSYYYYNEFSYLLFLFKLVATLSCDPVLRSPISKELVRRSTTTKYKKFESLVALCQELLQPPQQQLAIHKSSRQEVYLERINRAEPVHCVVYLYPEALCQWF